MNADAFNATTVKWHAAPPGPQREHLFGLLYPRIAKATATYAKTVNVHNVEDVTQLVALRFAKWSPDRNRTPNAYLYASVRWEVKRYIRDSIRRSYLLIGHARYNPDTTTPEEAALSHGFPSGGYCVDRGRTHPNTDDPTRTLGYYMPPGPLDDQTETTDVYAPQTVDADLARKLVKDPYPPNDWLSWQGEDCLEHLLDCLLRHKEPKVGQWDPYTVREALAAIRDASS